jgi:hypothetical protein
MPRSGAKPSVRLAAAAGVADRSYRACGKWPH